MVKLWMQRQGVISLYVSARKIFKCQESLCNNFKQIEVNGRKMAYVNQIWAYLIEMWTMQRFKF